MTNKLRLLVISHEDPEFILGGMGMHCRKLYEAMARRDDVEIDFLTSGPGEGSKEYLGYTKYQADKLVCWRPPSESLSSLLLSDVQMMRTFSQLLADGHRWDVVHMHEWTAVQVGRMARDALNVPLVGTMHLCITKLSEVEDGNPNILPAGKMSEADVYLRQQEGHLVVTDSDEFILCSQSYIDMVGEMFLTDRSINLIHNGIDLDEWNPSVGDGDRARKEHSLPDKPICLFVGRIADMKGIRTLLDVVEADDLGYCVVLAGEVNASTEKARESWDVTQRIKRIETEHSDRLRWVGFHHDQTLKDLYASAEVVVMPSAHEPFGIVALEAMAMGIPLVSTEVDGLGEIVNPSPGKEFSMIVRPNDPVDLAEGLRILRNNPEARAKLVSLGLERVHDFTWESAASKTVEVYHKAIGRSQGMSVLK